MHKKLDHTVITLSLIAAVAAVVVVVLLLSISGVLTGDNEYCRSVRQQKSISNSHTCSAGSEYQENGKTYVRVKFFGDNNSEVMDDSSFVIEKDTKKIVNEYIPI